MICTVADIEMRYMLEILCPFDAANNQGAKKSKIFLSKNPYTYCGY